MCSAVRKLGVVALIVAGLLAQAPAVADELSVAMPAESVLYIEWSGVDAVSEAHATTAMGKLLAEPEMKRFTAELEKGFNRMLIAPDASDGIKQFAMGMQMAKPLLSHFWHHRAALSVIGAETAEQGPGVAAALVIDLSADDEGFVAAFQGAITMATMQFPREAETVGEYTFQRVDLGVLPPLRYGKVEDKFLVALGTETLNNLLAVKDGTAPSLTTNDRFAAARKKVGGTARNTTTLLHLDLVRLREQIKPVLLEMTGSEEIPPEIATVLEELGINAIQSLTLSGQLADGGCRHIAYLATSGERKGLAKLLDAKPLTDEDFHAIPADANFAVVRNLDLPSAFDEATRILNAFIPDEFAEFNADFEELTGMKLREDVVALFDDGMAVFDAPSQGGLWVTGVNFVIETKDATAFIKMLENVVGLIRKEAGDHNLTLRNYEHNGHTIHYVTITAGPVPVSPAWGAHGNRVVFGLYPQTVIQTLDRLGASDVKDRCILANADFARGRKLVPPDCFEVSYVNTKAGVDGVYRVLMPALTAGFSFANSEGIRLDVSAIPSQPVITRHVFGDVYGFHSDETGLLMVGHGPLPFPMPAMSGGGSVTGAAMMTSIMLPSLVRARELAKRQVSGASLSAVSQACMLYAYEHQEQFPPDLETLVQNGSITRQSLISPLDPSLSPSRASDGDCSYIYIAGLTMKSPPNAVLAYEPDFSGEGGNILFVDGHVEWVKPPRYHDLIEKTQKKVP